MIQTQRQREIERLLVSGYQLFRRTVNVEQVRSGQRLLNDYKQVRAQINKWLRDLSILAASEGMTSRALANETTLIHLKDALRTALSGYAVKVGAEARTLQNEGIQAGLAVGRLAILATYDGTIAIPRLQTLINYVDSPAFQANLAQYAGYHADAVSAIVTIGLNKGKNPITIARQITNYVRDFPAADALRMTRTVGIWSARAANHAVYRTNPDVVQGWIWSTALDGSVCMSCYAMQGQIFPPDETLNDHHMGRCAPVPVTTSWADLGFDGQDNPPVPTGEDYFSQLPDKEQRSLMGAAQWTAWKDGAFKFEDQSTTYSDPIYGTMRKAASLDALVGPTAAANYKKAAAN